MLDPEKTRIPRLGSRLREVVETSRRKSLGTQAAALAYYGFVSVFPLVLLLLVVGSLTGLETVAIAAIESVSVYLSESGRRTLRQSVEVETSPTVGLIGLVGLLWGSLKFVRGLRKSFRVLYEDYARKTTHKSVLRTTRDSAAALFSVIAAVVTAAALRWLTRVLDVPDTGIALIGVVGLFFVFLPLYYFLPPVDVSLRHVYPGAVFASLGWVALETAFGFYVDLASSSPSGYAAYGAVGGVLVFLTWLYLGFWVILLGGAVCLAVDNTTQRNDR
ncbi:YihY/virulence factor BrkB family protein [Halorutilales archaeon Cl-col2-1]